MLTTANGLSQGMIFDILQSRDGFIWFATKDGLNRYDGARFEVYSSDLFNPFAIGGNEVRKLFEDSRGWIWIGMSEGLDVFDPVSSRFFHVLHEGRPFVSKKGGSMVEVQGVIWFSNEDIIWRISPQEDLLQKAIKQNNANIEPACQSIPLLKAGGAPLQVNHIFFTQNKKMLLGTSSGLYHMNIEHHNIELEGLPDSEIYLICQNGNGQIMVRNGSTEQKKITIWDEKEGIQNSRSVSHKNNLTISNSSKNIVFDAADNLWITQNNVLQRYRLHQFLNNAPPDIEWPFEKFLYPHAGFNFNTLFVDRSGMLWLGTNGFGIFKLNPNGPVFKSYLPGSSQRKIFEDANGNLITLHDVHVQYRSATFDQIEPNRSFKHARDFPWQLSAVFDAKGNCWVTDPGEPFLYRTDFYSKEKKAFPWKGFGLCFDQKGHLMSVSGEGLYAFDPATEQSAFYPFKAPMRQNTEFSHFLWKDTDGVMWIFGFEGLIKAIPSETGYQFEYFINNPKERSSLSSNTVLSVADDPQEPGRYLWIGTKSGGLNRLDKKTGHFKRYKMTEGLPDNVIYGVLSENNAPFIWLSTNKGLCRFDVRAETSKNFSVEDGLQDNEFNSASYLKTRNGTLIFGGVKGLTVFHPDSLRFNKNVPQIHIVGLSINNRKFDFWGKNVVNLAHDQNLITFDFAALEYTNPAQNLYRYQLVGVDKDWVVLGNKNSIQFANLAPGDYTFRVEGSNNDGVWGEQPAELHFTIRPPWWASWWACLIYLTMCATTVWLYYRYRLRQKIKHQESLRLREMDEFKGRFFTNITHEFRTPLTVILGMTERMLHDTTNQRIPAILAQPLHLIKRNGENLLRLVNEILDLAKLESNTLKMNYIQGDILTFIKYITESLHSLANAQNLVLIVECKQGQIIMDYDPERLLQIIHNLLSNAIKFTKSGGKVILSISTDPVGLKNQPCLNIRISDTGVGIPSEDLPYIFERFFQAQNQEHAKAGGAGIGLSLTRELVKTMGGEIAVESIVGSGTSFFIKLPITNNGMLEKEANTNMEVWKQSASKAKSSSIHGVAVARGSNHNAPTILLIEDNPDVVEYLTACLKDLNNNKRSSYQLYFAYNGQAGIEKAVEIVPDLIISDVMMPFKNGFEVLEILKNDERTSHIPIILLTAKADVQSRLAGLRKGADAYLAKPFNQEELLVTVENLLEQRRKLQQKYQQNLLSKEPEPLEVNADTEDAFLQQVKAIIESNYSRDTFGLPQLCQMIGMSRSQLFRKLKALIDMAPSDLIRIYRLNKAKELLKSGTFNVSEAAWQTGFKDSSYFSKMYQEEFGALPSDVYRTFE